MYLSVNNRDNSTSILSVKEIVGIIFIFSFVLYLLFPKKNIDQIIEGKGKNANLSINYLESMLLYYPESFRLKRILARNYASIGEVEKALDLTNQMIVETKNREQLVKLYKSQYLFMKEIYFKSGNPKLLKEIKSKLYSYFEYTKENPDYTFLFAESTQIDFRKLKYISLQGFMKDRPDLINYDFEKDLFLQAMALGYKDDSYQSLLRLLNYTEMDKELKIYAISALLEHKEYELVRELAIELFLNSSDDKSKMRFFNVALNATIKGDKEGISELLTLYQEHIKVSRSDIIFLMNTLLQLGDVKGASLFAQKVFVENQGAFDENITDLAIKSLIYAQDILPALDMALFAKDKFHTIVWLDKAIQLSLWSGKMREVMALNIEGYKEYKNQKYEKYILDSSNMHSAYEILGYIYTRKVEQGDYSFVPKLDEYYSYTGEIPRAEAYFTQLLKKVNRKEIHKEAILFTYRNSHYKKGIALYKKFQKRYGLDKELQELTIQKLIALKEFKEAYHYAQALKTDKRLIALGWRDKDYNFMFKRLWESENSEKLAFVNYDKLIKLEDALNRGERLPYLYDKLWKKTGNRVYLTSLLYQHLEHEDISKIKELLSGLSPKDREVFNKNIQYHIVLANYFIKSKDVSSALNEFKKALALDSTNASTHQAYLWFLLDNGLISSLKKELYLLRTHKKLQRSIGFPAVITALKLQKSDLALIWLKPLLKNTKYIEYQVVYADILELQGREEGAKKVRLKLFNRMNNSIKKNSKLLKEKEFARVYLGLVMRYTTPYAKKAYYFKKLKSLFTEREYNEMRLGWYSYTQSNDKVYYLSQKYKLNTSWLTLYLAMSQNNNLLKSQILKGDKSILPLRDRVTASLDIGDRAGAYSLAFMGLEENSRDSQLFRIYNDMINSDYPRAKFEIEYKHLTPNVSVVEKAFSYRWLYKGLRTTLSFEHNDYNRVKAKDREDSSLSLALKNSNKRFLWDIKVAHHHTQESFNSASLNLHYRFMPIDVGVEAHYQNKTTLTPQLQMNGLENSLALNLRATLSSRIQLVGFYKQSSYKKENNKKLGSSKQVQISGNYLLRAGYPDIRFNSYLNSNYYSSLVDSVLPNDFMEFGTQLTVGSATEGSLGQSWKPFGTVGFAINDKKDIGTSLSLGVSGSVNRADSLSVMLDYSKGIDAIAEPYYGFHIGYRF